MICGIGVDIIETSRIEKEIKRGGKDFLKSIFTAREIDYCESKRTKSLSYAARFAAKEALVKALGTGIRDNIIWKDIEIINNELGKPQFQFHGNTEKLIKKLEIKNIQLSIAHEKNLATAFVILEK